MNDLITWVPSAAEIQQLRERLADCGEVMPFSEDIQFAAKIASLGMQRETGTLNDEMARFLFDANSGQVINRDSLRADLVMYRGAVGVRVWSLATNRIEIRCPGIRPLLHPRFSVDGQGEIHQLVIFPESVYQFLATQGVEPVIVKSWAQNTIFGGFHPSTNFYQTNMWELSNNDTRRFSRLVAARQVPFLGTHDFVAHIAGTDGSRWEKLQERGTVVRDILDKYFETIQNPSITSLVLPYVAGVLLDDLAQPPSYDDETRSIPLDLVCAELAKGSIDPRERRVLTKFPEHYEKLIDLARFKGVGDVRRLASGYVRTMVEELLGFSVLIK